MDIITRLSFLMLACIVLVSLLDKNAIHQASSGDANTAGLTGGIIVFAAVMFFFLSVVNRK